MSALTKTEAFDQWLRELDIDVQARVRVQIRRLEQSGNSGSLKLVGGNVLALPVDYGVRYWVYFTRRAHDRLVLLCGGDDHSSERDSQIARCLALEVEED